jgi:hypothetical protein
VATPTKHSNRSRAGQRTQIQDVKETSARPNVVDRRSGRGVLDGHVFRDSSDVRSEPLDIAVAMMQNATESGRVALAEGMRSRETPNWSYPR